MGKKTYSQSGLIRNTLAVSKAESEDFRPSDFMRARRPALFSDTEIIGNVWLSREIFEYHLDTLTNRKQEGDFEHFCRRLAEREICPNLLPQTGPTGGGDSKVDTETYPVADEIALRWYDGIGRESSHERWAFAFSAKRAWRSKVQSDVTKLVQTSRGYCLIYFITNQFIKDKDRSAVEDELSRKHKVTVRLLDRTWIVKCVFEHSRQQLAVETLNISGYDSIIQKIVGPNDAQRAIELKNLEQEIDDPKRYTGVEYQLAEDCLQTAILARGLNHPRVEVEGRFERAKRVAGKVGHKQQILRITYNHAWSVFWWYNDFEQLNSLYDTVENLTYNTEQSSDLELLTNLWSVLHTTVKRGSLGRTNAKLDARTTYLKVALQRLMVESHRPNNALQARLNLLLIELAETLLSDAFPDKVLKELKNALSMSDGLAQVPIDSMIQIVEELGEVLSNSAEYNDLFEVAVALAEKRKSKGETGLMLLKAGYQKLRTGKRYDAIRLLGRAQQKLALEEYSSEWSEAIASCGVAYETAGLLWAARSNMLLAANEALSKYWKHGEIVPQALRYIQRLIWLELQLGRVFCAIAWIEQASYFASHILMNDAQKADFTKERQSQDIVLGVLLLKTDLWELQGLDFLPQILDELALYNSWMALLYALGHEDHLFSEGVIPEDQDTDSVYELFRDLLRQSIVEDLPERPELLQNDTIVMRSFVLGCEVIIETANVSDSISLAETILGAIEALLATSLDREIYPYRAELYLDLRPSTYINGLPKHWIDKNDPNQTIYIRHAPTIWINKSDAQENFNLWFRELVVHVVLQIASIPDPELFSSQIFEEELGLNRALNVLGSKIAVENILGKSPKFRLSDWKAQSVTKLFPLQRHSPWFRKVSHESTDNNERQPWQPAEGEPSADLFGIDNLKHKQRRVISLINLPLWDKAKWRATAYVYIPNLPPFLALCFTDPEPAIQIFDHWRNKIGPTDRSEQLRVSIVTGIDRKHPSSYRVIISTNPNLRGEHQANQWLILARICQMDPPNLVNLDNFTEQYKLIGSYRLLPAQLKSKTEFPEPFWNLAIEKQELRICPAWQIGENDQDVSAIQKGDEPIIPADVKNAPVIRALQRFDRQR